MASTTSSFGSLFEDATYMYGAPNLNPVIPVEPCGAAADYRFQRGEPLTQSQLQRMCRQDDCIVTANRILLMAKHYGSPAAELVPAMEQFVTPMIDYCYYNRLPGQSCPDDFVGQMLQDLHELTAACETKSGFSITTNRPPALVFNAQGTATNESVLHPLCGVSECDNLMKRLELKEEVATCLLDPAAQDNLTAFVFAYVRECDVRGTLPWAPHFYSMRERMRPVYFPLADVKPEIPLTTSPLPTPVPATTPTPSTTAPSVEEENEEDSADPSEPASTVAIVTSKPPMTLTSSSSASQTVIAANSNNTQSSRSNVSSGGFQEDWTLSSTTRGVPTPTRPTAPNEDTETPTPLINAQSAPTSPDVLLLGAIGAAVGVLIVLVALVLRRRQQRRCFDEKLSATTDEDYHSLDANSDTISSSNLLGSVHLSCRSIPSSQLTDLQIIGGGGSGIVYVVQYNGEDRSDYDGVLAAKRVNNNGSASSIDQINGLVEEINVAASLSHPRIVTFVGVAGHHRTELQALFEYLPGGDLKRYLEMLPPPDLSTSSWTPEKLQIAVDIADALVYLHTLQPTPVVHRDLKSRNVMLTSDKRAKLGDFGVSRTESIAGSMTTGVGTSRWVAPEVILGGGEYTTACDIYSFGVVLSELDTHQLPFSAMVDANGEPLADFHVLLAVATQHQQPSFSDACPESILELARRCLSYEPTQRPVAAEVAEALRVAQKNLGW